MTTRLFVDETKQRGYRLVAVRVVPEALDVTRKSLRGLVLPGQNRLHMKDESDPRKRAIAAAIVSSGVRATVYDAGRRHRNELERRHACLDALMADAAAMAGALIVLEADETLVADDRRTLYRAARAAGCAETVRYEHQRAAAELLLSLPDAVAWCWAKGGDWRRRVDAVVGDVREV